MRTRFFIVLSAILFSLPCFAERKTRVDSYGNQKCKIIWSSKATAGPNQENWAKNSWGTGWVSILRYCYLLDAKNQPQKTDRVDVTLYEADTNYVVRVEILKDGMWEDYSKKTYYSYDQAKYNFDKWSNLFEMNISFDEQGDIK